MPGITSVEHYFNQEFNSDLLDNSNPTIGLTSTAIIIDQGFLNCKFTRDNSNINKKFFDIYKNNTYILIAYGSGNFD